MLDSSILDQFIGYEWEQTCIATYGVDQDVPLDPSFNPGVISQVTANGTPIVQGTTLNGQQTIRVYGSNLYGSNFKLIANNVEYTPLEFGDGYIQYSITANADITMWLNGRQYMSFRVEGITPPTALTGRVIGRQAAESGAPDGVNQVATNDGCLNYPYLATQALPWYRLEIFCVEGTTDILNDLTLVNCTSGYHFWSETSTKLILFVTPTDFNKPVYIIYEGFIFFVSNYQ